MVRENACYIIQKLFDKVKGSISNWWKCFLAISITNFRVGSTKPLSMGWHIKFNHHSYSFLSGIFNYIFSIINRISFLFRIGRFCRYFWEVLWSKRERLIINHVPMQDICFWISHCINDMLHWSEWLKMSTCVNQKFSMHKSGVICNFPRYSRNKIC